MKNFLICIVFLTSCASGVVFAQETDQNQEQAICFTECNETSSFYRALLVLGKVVGEVVGFKTEHKTDSNECVLYGVSGNQKPSPVSVMNNQTIVLNGENSTVHFKLQVFHKEPINKKDTFDQIVNTYVEQGLCKSVTDLSNPDDDKE